MSIRRKSPWEDLLCGGLLLVAAGLALLPVLRSGAVPMGLESVLFMAPWEEMRPEGLDPASDSSVALQAQQHYPAYRFLSESAKNKQSLLWNPYEGMGTPFLATWRSRVFSPFSLPLYFLPLAKAIQWSVFLKLMVAGLCAYYAARRLAFPAAMALLVGVSFQMSGPVYLWCGFPLSDVVPWLPLLLIGVERLSMGQVRAWPLVSLTLALMGLGGDPAAFGGILLFTVAYVLVRRFRAPKTTSLQGASIGLAFGIAGGLGLLGVQLLPYLEYLTQASAGQRGLRLDLYLSDLLTMLAPGLVAPGRTDTRLIIRLIYVGTAQFLLIALWFAVRDQAGRPMRRRMESLFITSLLFTLMGLVAGPLFDRLPLLRYLAPQHFFLTTSLAFAFLTAAAAEVWNELDPEQCKAALKKLTLYVPALWILSFLGVIFLAVGIGASGATMWGNVGITLLVALALLVLFAATLFRPSVRLTGYTLSGISFLTFWLVSGGAPPRTDAAAAFPETAMIKSLSAMNTRISGSRALAQWPLSANEIPQVFSPGGVRLARLDSFIARTKEEPLLLRRTGSQALLLTKEDIQADFAPIRPQLHVKEVYPSGAVLFQDLEALPRAHMQYEGRILDAEKNAHVEEGKPPLLEGVALASHAETPYGPAEIVAEENGRVQVRVSGARPGGLLVLADTWYPGWRATVDGESAEVHPVDRVFRGVKVPEGDHEILFTYAPESLKFGIWVSLITGLIVVFELRHVLRRGSLGDDR